MKVKAYLEITMFIDPENRPAAAKVYTDYRHGFDSMEHAKAYLESDLFQNDVFVGLKPTWAADPDVRFYEGA